MKEVEIIPYPEIIIYLQNKLLKSYYFLVFKGDLDDEISICVKLVNIFFDVI